MTQRLTLPILHFNDVYRVRQKHPKTGEVLGADQFAALINALRKKWGEKDQVCQRPVPDRPFEWESHARRDRRGLVVFSGDTFNPSVESSITRGSHMVPVINAMQIDTAVLGNHDWDFGYPHLQRLLSKTNFPWLFSNVVDASWREDAPSQDSSDEQIYGTLPYFVMSVKGIKVGCIGLVEREWLETVPDFPKQFEYRDMVDVAQRLSRELREGPEQCELIIAATHCRLPNDVMLANALGAVQPADRNKHGVDLVLGGHDHVYYIGRGVDKYEGAPFDAEMVGSQEDKHTLIIKSGTDFHDLSEIQLTVSEPHDAVRRRTIERIEVQRHSLEPSDPSQPELREMLDQLMARVSKSTEQPVALTMNAWDLRAESVRTDESGIGDLIADILLISMERKLRFETQTPGVSAEVSDGERMADCCIICGGSLRSDSVIGPGLITLGNILEVMPFEDPIVVKELRGQDIWDALENGFSSYPKQEGRFPQVAGMQVVWDSRREPGKRVVSVHLLDQPFDGANDGGTDLRMKIRNSYMYNAAQHQDDDTVMVHRITPRVKEELDLNKKYSVVTRGYLANGNDGYEALTRGDWIVDDEAGQLMSTIVRKFMLGATHIWRWNQLRTRNEGRRHSMSAASPPVSRASRRASLLEHLLNIHTQSESHLSHQTDTAIERAYNMQHAHHTEPSSEGPVPKRRRSMSFGMLRRELVVDHTPASIRDALFVASHEHHSHFDTASRIDTSVVMSPGCSKEDLAVVMALTDGRMRDMARS